MNQHPVNQKLRERFGSVGVWLGPLAQQSTRDERQAVTRLEGLGYRALWFAEIIHNREAFTHAAVLLAATEHIQVATGIANIWARDPAAAANAERTLGEAFGERFLLGLGVSHAPYVDVRGHSYTRPLTAMREYLETMDRHVGHAPGPRRPSTRVLAALGPRMLELARDRAAGAHTYLVTSEHTRRAREILGCGPFLAPTQTVVLQRDPDRARSLARKFAGIYLTLPNYLNNLRALGFHERDFQNGGSDPLIDAIVAWGPPEVIARRVRAHLDAGADHVAVQAFAETPKGALRDLVELASSLL